MIPDPLQRGEAHFAFRCMCFFVNGLRHEGKHDAYCKNISIFLFLLVYEKGALCVEHIIYKLKEPKEASV